MSYYHYEDEDKLGRTTGGRTQAEKETDYWVKQWFGKSSAELRQMLEQEQWSLGAHAHSPLSEPAILIIECRIKAMEWLLEADTSDMM